MISNAYIAVLSCFLYTSIIAALHAVYSEALGMEREKYMLEALSLAREAARDGEVPVGCVIVKDGVIIGRGRNRRERDRSALAHAEILSIDQACKALGSWRLNDCSLYVSLEPCPMCAGAIMNARLDEVIFGARDERMGALGGVMDLYYENFGYFPRVYGGVLESESSALLSDFFSSLRSPPNKE